MLNEESFDMAGGAVSPAEKSSTETPADLETLVGFLTAPGNGLKDYQSIPFWSWNDKLEPGELRRQIRAMKEAGIGGFFMHARGGLITPYMSDEWMNAVGVCIDEAKKQGMDAWCYDENGWPSGFAGMKLLEDPANLESYIVCEKKAGFDPAALGVYVLDGSALRRVDRAENGIAEYITVYEKKNSSVVDILNRDIVRKFLDETHEKYYARFADAFGDPMMGFFTDEPQYFRYDTAYTPCLLPEYRALYGSDLLDELGALFVDCDGAKRFRFRYWKLMNRLYIDSFAKQIFEWCTEHNCRLTGHSIEERDLFWQMICTAGVMPFYKYEHKPGIDWLGRGIFTEACPKQLGSVAQQYGKKHALTETFACAGWDVTPKELKRIAEWQYVNGVNQMCQHLYPYSIRGQRKRDYPAFYSEHNTWTRTPAFRRFNDYFTRLGYMLAESREKADVAVIHPMHSAYLTFDRNDENSVKALNDRFEELIEKLGRANIGHHFVDESLLAEDGGADGNELVMGLCRYKTVVLPEMEGLDANTVRVLKTFTENGGRLYLAGKAPHLSDGEKADLSFLRSNVTFEDLKDDEYSIDTPETEIRSTFRHAGFGRFLYAVNLSKDASYSVEYRLAAKGAELFDAAEGKVRPVAFRKDGTGIVVPLTFAPGDSVILLLNDGAESLKPEGAPQKTLRLPDTAKIVSRDENTLTLDTAELSYDGSTWTRPMPVMALSDRLLRERVNRTVWLRYAFTVETVPAKVRVECEKMNAKRVTLNGKVLDLEGPGSFDRAFVTADITGLIRPGRNEIVYEIGYFETEEVYNVFNGMYYEHSDGTETLLNCLSYLTDIESVYLRGDFGVKTASFTAGEKDTFSAAGEFTLCEAADTVRTDRLIQEGYPFFGGSMTFRFDVEADGDETILPLDGRYLTACVRVNGGREQTLLFGEPADVRGQLKKGLNTVEVTLVSSLRNVFGPHHYAPDPEPYGVDPGLFSGYGAWESGTGESRSYDPAYSFKFFGLNG